MRRVLSAAFVLCASVSAADPAVLLPLSGGTFRYKDVAGQAYAASFISAFSYDHADVRVTLESNGTYLTGALGATGLKPNFAYQIKLIGLPSRDPAIPAESADDATNERIGRLGRWWRAQPNPANSNDADYDANKDTPGYLYDGYLLMAFFVTDAEGKAQVNFVGNNSYHVLWRTDQRPPSAQDGPRSDVTLAATAGNPAYDVSLAARAATLYGEYESTRALPGKLEMPVGHYRCKFLLTEESFHDYGALGGNWAHAMSALVEFDMGQPTESVLPGKLTIERLNGGLGVQRSGADWLRVLGELDLPAELELQGLEVRASVMGAARTFELDRFGRASSQGCQLLMRRELKNASRVRFLLTLRDVALVLHDSSSKLNATLNLTITGSEYALAFEPRIKLGRHSGRVVFQP